MRTCTLQTDSVTLLGPTGARSDAPGPMSHWPYMTITPALTGVGTQPAYLAGLRHHALPTVLANKTAFLGKPSVVVGPGEWALHVGSLQAVLPNRF